MNFRDKHNHGYAPWIGILALICAGPAAAGPNAGGKLILHANPAIAYCTDDVTYCGQSNLATCDAAISSVAGGDPVVFFAIAAFPLSSSPRLSGITFGVYYNTPNVALLDWGSCGDFELPTSGWPASGEGTAVTWNTARTSVLVEVYWFAGYNYYAPQPASFGVTYHPTQGAFFADDSVPAQLDAVAGFGILGFDQAGAAPCFDDTRRGACCLPDPCGLCEFVSADECAANGGTYQGDDVTCEPNPCDCPPIFGACCVGCTCFVTTRGDCAGSGGVYYGDDTLCQQVSCGDPTLSVCCLPDGSCLVISQCDCTNAGGEWNGDNPECAPTTCSPVPTERSTWGLIKGRYR